MLNNNETESEYIGWAVQSVEFSYYDNTLKVTGWETISNRTRMNEITVRALDMRKHHFRAVVPVIYASSINGKQTFSVVSQIFKDHVKKIIIALYIYCKILYLFQDDLGAPLSKNNIVLGILVKLPEASESPAVFVDIFKSYTEINYLINDCVLVHRKSLPRKKARFDHLIPRAPKKLSYSFQASRKRKHETSSSKS